MTTPELPATQRLIQAPEGMPYARRVVADYLREYLPTYLADLRVLWGLEEKYLPDPAEVLPRPALVAGDKWPRIAVASVTDTLNGRTDAQGGSIEYGTTYTLRVFDWIVAPDLDLVWDMRDWYSSAIRVSLLDSPTLRGKPVVVQEAGVATAAGEPEKVNGDRWLVGSFITVRLLVREALVRVPGATVASVRVDADALMPVPMRPPSGLLPAPIYSAPHPALD